jgi:lipopolysaccharide transport system ATP-binding protein
MDPVMELARRHDTPVKRYSSGMYVRLAFAVAAHLKPEILVVDEVLAVGDAEFPKKCLGEEFSAESGRTVLFVSHSMTAILALCGRAIAMTAGRIQSDGDPEKTITDYLLKNRVDRGSFTDLSQRGDRSGSNRAQLSEEH